MAAALAANEVISFYSYTPIADPQAHAAWQRETGAQLALHGRVIVASEGVSGTASGAAAATREYLRHALGGDGALVRIDPVSHQRIIYELGHAEWMRSCRFIHMAFYTTSRTSIWQSAKHGDVLLHTPVSNELFLISSNLVEDEAINAIHCIGFTA